MDVSSNWIDQSVCQAILSKDVNVLVAVDGSDNSMVALAYVSDGLMQYDKKAFAQILHIYDDNKDYLPVSCQQKALFSTCETKMTTSVSAKRYQLNWVSKEMAAGLGVGDLLCREIARMPAHFIFMGFFGLKGIKEAHDILGARLCTNVADVLSLGNSCSLVCFKDESADKLPVKGRKAVFVVSVSLNKSSTKAFLDALKLSKPGDEIHVVYVKGYMEREDSDYTTAMRQKYELFFSGLQDGKQEVFFKFHDRAVSFVLVDKHRRESTPQAVVRYADSVEADFLVVGANAADRVARGKKPVGSVSLQICLLTDRNFVVANWVDVAPEVYEANVRRAFSPAAPVAAVSGEL